MGEEKQNYTELAEYIKALIKAQNLSQRQASMRSGLDPTTISKIFMRGGASVPTPDTLEKLARGLNGDFLRMMTLAGHLPPGQGDDEELDAELYSKLQRLQYLVHEVAKHDPDAASRLMGLLVTPFEIMLALETEEAEEVPIDETVV